MSGQRQLLSLGYESCGCLMLIEEPAATGESINRKLTRLLRQSLSSSDARSSMTSRHNVTNEMLYTIFRMLKDPFLSIRKKKTAFGNNTKAIY